MTILTAKNRQRCRSCRKYKGIGGFDSHGKCPKCSTICENPGCEKERPSLSIIHDDPYCSNVCAREAYGNPMPLSQYESSKSPKVGMYYRKKDQSFILAEGNVKGKDATEGT